MTPEQLDQIIKAFPNDGRRHHHALIRELAQALLKKQFEAFMLKAEVDSLRKVVKGRPVPFVADCDQEVA
jgi:hypothetical protein